MPACSTPLEDEPDSPVAVDHLRSDVARIRAGQEDDAGGDLDRLLRDIPRVDESAVSRETSI